MAFGIPLLVLCSAINVFSGGKLGYYLIILAAFLAIKSQEASKTKNSRLDAPQSSVNSKDVLNSKESPIYAVDFTSTTFTPTESTTIPKAVPLRSRAKRSPKVIKAAKPIPNNLAEASLTKSSVNLLQSQVYIFYTTLTGSSQRVAQALHTKLTNLDGLANPPKMLSLDDDVDDLEEFFLKTPKNGDTKSIYLLVLPSYETDSPIDYFLEHLSETYNDFRVDKYPLRSLLGFAVLGLGDSESWNGEKFCYQAKLADRWLGKLGGRRLFPLGEVCMKFEGEPKAQDWIQSFATLLADDEPFYLDNDDDIDDSDREDEEVDDADTLVDVEDMGNIIRKSGTTSIGMSEAKKMVAKDSPTYKSLTKQGYTIVGSHSGVKICRWTKSALRGRGSCYKFAFYGIKSHLCMETTPSLACSNKCVFCWRHGTNPVAKLNWRWELDPPEKVFEGALAGHYQKIKQMRGVPGIQNDRFQEAFQVKHCALSLVGEPIFYPHINEFVDLLHKQHISSFLVCNAQHPDNLAKLAKVTQLYVSIDAPTRTDLKKVDRPLNSDFWERLMACLDILRTTQSHQRTVFRLTLVKGFNMNDIASYADMVIQAQPSQIEVKGATFCGSSNGNGNPLTMQNIPFYEECKLFVVSLVEELNSRGHSYEVAAEHAHSCCILIAHTKFKINGKWHTHIDYPKFFQLLESGEEFNDLDYVKETPEWAVWGSEEAGFNPDDTRYDRKAEKLRKKLEREDLSRKIQASK
ncbi:Fe-S oxidoreductase [Suhomyces tanzawaensis NRRL Y-17324]|uniref:S-adenosyl-L-methionine-dependent tRNA 4-demethylwyosine synthase n=1 Tax=Suhomyces tanzawaensis NRRL Y-17324 TaxID=984487 RepID=A0A1E4SR10_9ASCO|nr:Fe-S oxidoreductase [Suhomyces tanzawaensis NRRL Y-17324]ODV81935.1 Fe-S oxidoreductase [Suhomyces tanzawaensis NRRL Y-17324]